MNFRWSDKIRIQRKILLKFILKYLRQNSRIHPQSTKSSYSQKKAFILIHFPVRISVCFFAKNEKKKKLFIDFSFWIISNIFFLPSVLTFYAVFSLLRVFLANKIHFGGFAVTSSRENETVQKCSYAKHVRWMFVYGQVYILTET